MSNFGTATTAYGGAVFNRGSFTAANVGFTRNQARVGAVCYTGPVSEGGFQGGEVVEPAGAPRVAVAAARAEAAAARPSLRGAPAAADAAVLGRSRVDDDGWGGSNGGATLVVQSDSCSSGDASSNGSAAAFYATASSAAYLFCSPTCGFAGNGTLARSTTCAPTAAPTPASSHPPSPSPSA